MSVFKRIGNVARGKMKAFGRSFEGGVAGGEPDELDPDRPPVRSPTSRTAPLSTTSKREMLERLRSEGLLTDEEFDEKMAALEAPSALTPKKRQL